jgi:hypothetical protein
MIFCCRLFLLSVILGSCLSQKQVKKISTLRLNYLDDYSIPLKTIFQGTTVGGLSGIDYDKASDTYYLISDDGSKINKARYYKAKIGLGKQGIDSVRLMEVHTLVQANDSPYSYSGVDPEGIRINPREGTITWTSEGEKAFRNNDTSLRQPSINSSTIAGKLRYRFELPPGMVMKPGAEGLRSNASFEGLSFTDNYKTLFVNVEEPLYDDGPRAGTGDSGAYIRLIKLDVKSRRPVAQYAYRIDPVAYPAIPAGAFKINGAAEILCLDNRRMLVLERSFSTGRQGCVVKIFLADLSNATDVGSIKSLDADNSFTPVSKKLIFHSEQIGIPVFNVEGMCFGPKLQNGRQSLILVADDNFSTLDKTQFLLLEIE